MGTPLRDPNDAARLLALRLAALQRSQLLDRGGDPGLDRLARVAAVAVGAPTALVSLVDDRRQYFAGQAGLGAPWCDVRQTPLSHSFCQIVVNEGKPLIVNDAPEDPRVAANLAIPDLGVQAYAGVPLADRDGTVLGSLCVIDDEPRVWTDNELAVLTDVALAVEAELRYRIELEDAAAHLALLADVTAALHSELDIDAALRGLTDRVVPALADICAVDLFTGDERHLQTAAVAAVRPRLAELLQAAEQSAPRRDNPASAVHRVLRGGPSELVVITDEVLGALCSTPGDRALYDEMRLRSSVVVPISSRRGVLGVLTFARTGDSSVQAAADVRLAEEIGRRVGLAIDNAWLYTREHRSAVALQQSLLPAVPRSLPGLTLAARYRPSEQGDQVGGDWYDVLPLPDGQLGLAIGDVAGHDMGAAAVMGQLRAILRSYAFEGHRPGDVLDRTCQLAREVQERRTATIVYGVLSAAAPDGSRTFTYGNAGHPPALVLRPDGTTEALDAATSPLIGINVPPRRNATVHLPAGSALVLYTDGLVERRDDIIDAGIDDVRRTLVATAECDLDAAADELMQVAGPRPADDVALLLVRLDAR